MYYRYSILNCVSLIKKISFFIFISCHVFQLQSMGSRALHLAVQEVNMRRLNGLWATCRTDEELLSALRMPVEIDSHTFGREVDEALRRSLRHQEALSEALRRREQGDTGSIFIEHEDTSTLQKASDETAQVEQRINAIIRNGNCQESDKSFIAHALCLGVFDPVELLSALTYPKDTDKPEAEQKLCDQLSAMIKLARIMNETHPFDNYALYNDICYWVKTAKDKETMRKVIGFVRAKRDYFALRYKTEGNAERAVKIAPAIREMIPFFKATACFKEGEENKCILHGEYDPFTIEVVFTSLLHTLYYAKNAEIVHSSAHAANQRPDDQVIERLSGVIQQLCSLNYNLPDEPSIHLDELLDLADRLQIPEIAHAVALFVKEGKDYEMINSFACHLQSHHLTLLMKYESNRSFLTYCLLCKLAHMHKGSLPNLAVTGEAKSEHWATRWSLLCDLGIRFENRNNPCFNHIRLGELQALCNMVRSKLSVLDSVQDTQDRVYALVSLLIDFFTKAEIQKNWLINPYKTQLLITDIYQWLDASIIRWEIKSKYEAFLEYQAQCARVTVKDSSFSFQCSNKPAQLAVNEHLVLEDCKPLSIVVFLTLLYKRYRDRNYLLDLVYEYGNIDVNEICRLAEIWNVTHLTDALYKDSQNAVKSGSKTSLLSRTFQ